MTNFKSASDRFVQAKFDASFLQSDTLMQIFQSGDDEVTFAEVVLFGQLLHYGIAKHGQFIV
jgi:hypothetical protein